MEPELLRATAVIPATFWPRGQEVGTVTLIYADRNRRRIRLTDDAGRPFLLDLERPVRLADGDGLQLMGHGFIRVIAAPEMLLEAVARDATHLARLAWHVGNRHTAAEIVEPLRLRLVDDAVLHAMLRGLGAELTRVEAPFHPEGGAYGHEHGPHTHSH
ncbi:urease accessory protein UreE [Dongia sp.]|uniref:urease accessory protein UreE n=1 Tax=Dongia sp. TaxID=1977262 RepID=UPI0035AF2228